MDHFTGMEYLMIDIASNFGLDKEPWSDRLSWFTKNEPDLEKLVHKAEEPALFYAGVKAYRKAQEGKATGYPIALDATASGLQILACLVGDNLAGRLCNLVDIGVRADCYTMVYEQMLQITGDTAKIKRADCKQAIMTSLYGSTAMPKVVFGEGEMLKVFEHVMETNAPGVWELNQVMLDIWDSTALEHNWLMPDDFHVHIRVIDSTTERVNFLNEPFDVVRKVNMPREKGRSLCANMTHSIDGMIVREMVRRCNYDRKNISILKDMLNAPSGWQGGTSTDNDDDRMVIYLWSHYQKSGYLSARILDHLTIHNLGHVDIPTVLALVESLPAAPFEILPIHDCFRCLPNYGNDLRRQYNLQLHLLAKSNMLSYLLSQIMLRDIPVGKLDDTLADKILHANYALS